MTLLHMAAGYRHSAELIYLRIVALKEASLGADREERRSLEQRIRELSVLYRDTQTTARMLERYYDRRYHENARHTL